MSSIEFRQTVPEELAGIREFLARVFGGGKDVHSLRPELMAWKYYEPRPDWDGSRSYVLESGGKIISHGCVEPMTFETSGGIVRACQIIDWAADPTFPGAGLLLRRRIAQRVDVCLGVGGSVDSRKVMPRAGYRTQCQYRTFARAIRPLKQIALRTDGSLVRRLALAARGLAWSLKPLSKVSRGWSAELLGDGVEAEAPEDVPYVRTQRTAALLQYLRRCPAARMQLFKLVQEGRAAGYFLLSSVGGQTRIADLQVRAGGWTAAVALAAQQAAQLPDACEVVCSVSLPEAAQALLANNFQPRGEQPVFVADPKGILIDTPLHITAVDYDDFFAFNPAFPFVT